MKEAQQGCDVLGCTHLRLSFFKALFACVLTYAIAACARERMTHPMQSLACACGKVSSIDRMSCTLSRASSFGRFHCVARLAHSSSRCNFRHSSLDRGGESSGLRASAGARAARMFRLCRIRLQSRTARLHPSCHEAIWNSEPQVLQIDFSQIIQ